MALRASNTAPLLARVLEQPTQPQPGPQYPPAAKQSQYIFRHWLRLQLQRLTARDRMGSPEEKTLLPFLLIICGARTGVTPVVAQEETALAETVPVAFGPKSPFTPSGRVAA